MCLVTNKGIYIADRDIECYKILKLGREITNTIKYTNTINYFIRSPYQINHIITDKHLNVDMSISFNKVGYYQNNYKFKNIFKKTFKKIFKKEKNIFIGLHSFSDFNDAKKDCSIERDEFIVKCIIPKGTKYIKGYQATSHSDDNSIIDRYKDVEQYASETLILGNILSLLASDNIHLTYNIIK